MKVEVGCCTGGIFVPLAAFEWDERDDLCLPPAEVNAIVTHVRLHGPDGPVVGPLPCKRYTAQTSDSL